MRIREHVNLARLSYINIGPYTDKLYIAESMDDLKDAGQCKILGNLSNILFIKSRYSIKFMKLSGHFNHIEIDRENNKARAGAGNTIIRMISVLSDSNLGGLEKLSGIPGTIGGMIRNNAGAFGMSIADRLAGIETPEGYRDISASDFSYREGIDSTILFAHFNVSPKDKKSIIEEIDGVSAIRETSQPQGKTLGSVFKNPGGKLKAWELIDRCRLRGFSVNDIYVSKKHCNFFINRGSGTADDFLRLGDIVRERVMKEFNIELEYEIELF
ncbi:MAG: FAD-binding protein [bacterium]